MQSSVDVKRARHAFKFGRARFRSLEVVAMDANDGGLMWGQGVREEGMPVAEAGAVAPSPRGRCPLRRGTGAARCRLSFLGQPGQASHVACYTRHTLHVTHHTSHVTRCKLHATSNTSVLERDLFDTRVRAVEERAMAAAACDVTRY